MSDLLGSPHVAPFFWVLQCTIPTCHFSSQWVRPSPSPSALGRSSIRSPDRKIQAVEIARLEFFSVFCRVEDPIVRGRSAETTGFLDGRGESYGWKRLVEGMGPVGDR